MEGYEIDKCLDSMSVIVDTREQPSAKALQRYEAFGVPYDRQTLDFGDYTFNFRLPCGSPLYSPNTSRIVPKVAVERKMNLEELSSCFCQNRERFRREFERAQEHGAKMYLLVENASWEKILHGRYKTKFNSKAFMASLLSWSVKYNYQIIFCQSEISGQIIKEILYRELKSMLERGEFDWPAKDI